MATFRFEISNLNILLAVVAVHGVTDFDSCYWILVYPAFLSIPNVLATPVFFMLSVIHFSDDLNVFGSVLLHSLIILSVALKRQDLGFKAVVFFLGFVHTPLHYVRCMHEQRYAALALALISTFVGVRFSQKLKLDTLLFSHLMQKIVGAHIVVEFIIKINKR